MPELPHPTYCHCGGKYVHSHIGLGPLGSRYMEEFVAYCAACERMAWVVQTALIKELILKRAPLGATALLSIKSRTDGMAEVTYACGTGVKATILTAHAYDQRTEAMGINPNDILQNTWDLMDQSVKLIRESDDTELVEKEKIRGRAYAEVLSYMMPPFFTDMTEISREAQRRYEHRDDDTYETPGLGQDSLKEFLRAAPQMGSRRPTPAVNRPARSTVRPHAKPFEPDEKLRGTIVMARDSKMFTLPQLAKMYETSEANIAAL